MEYPEIVLSILICTLESRKKQLGFIWEKLVNQKFPYEDKVEILIESDNGEVDVGTKRNTLLSKAKGMYVCFVDDDDDVSNDYLESIMTSLKTIPDCVGIEGILKCKNGDLVFRHSIQFQGWYTGVDGFYRTPNHLNPVKRKIAESVGFPNKSYGEDHWYSNGIKSKLKTEVYINHPIYFYLKPEDII